MPKMSNNDFKRLPHSKTANVGGEKIHAAVAAEFSSYSCDKNVTPFTM